MALLHKALEPPVAAQFIGGFRGAALEKNCGLTNPIPAEMFNVSTENREWVNRRCVPQALATFEMPVLLSGKIENVKRRLYILADGWDPVRSAISPSYILERRAGTLSKCLAGTMSWSISRTSWPPSSQS